MYGVVLALLAGVHGGLVLRRRLRRRRRVEVEGPRCAGCGYILYGGTAAAVCPECGRACAADRFEAEGPARPISPVPVILAAWVVLFPAVVGAAYPVAAAAFPGVWRGRGWATVPTPLGDAVVWGSVRGRWSSKRGWGCDVRLPLPVDGRYYRVDLAAMTMSAGEWGNPTPIPVEHAAIAKEFLARGAAGAAESLDPATERAVTEVVREIRDLREGRWDEGRFVYEMSGQYLVESEGGREQWFWLPSYTWACVPVWVGVGVVVTRWLVRRYRREVGAWEGAREAWLSEVDKACPAVVE